MHRSGWDYEAIAAVRIGEHNTPAGLSDPLFELFEHVCDKSVHYACG